VISIISILTVIGGANYINSLKRSRDSRRMADLEQVRAALEMYRTDHTGYPTSADYAALYTLLSTNTPPYLTKKPVDPLGDDYVYHPDTVAPVGESYELCTTLETSTGTCAGGSGNYGVTNP
jgi:general secretion pathway protein G